MRRRNMRLNHAGGVKQFVTVRESGIERRPSLWNGKMGMHRGGIGEARYAYAPGRSSAVFLFDGMGHGNGDRDCEPARLVAARMGEIEGEPPRTERRNPVIRGGVLLLDTQRPSRTPVICQGRIFSPMPAFASTHLRRVLINAQIAAGLRAYFAVIATIVDQAHNSN